MNVTGRNSNKEKDAGAAAQVLWAHRFAVEVSSPVMTWQHPQNRNWVHGQVGMETEEKGSARSS